MDGDLTIKLWVAAFQGRASLRLGWNGAGGSLLEEMVTCRSRRGNRWEQLVARPRVVREAMEKCNRGWEVARGIMEV